MPKPGLPTGVRSIVDTPRRVAVEPRGVELKADTGRCQVCDALFRLDENFDEIADALQTCTRTDCRRKAIHALNIEARQWRRAARLVQRIAELRPAAYPMPELALSNLREDARKLLDIKRCESCQARDAKPGQKLCEECRAVHRGGLADLEVWRG